MFPSWSNRDDTFVICVFVSLALFIWMTAAAAALAWDPPILVGNCAPIFCSVRFFKHSGTKVLLHLFFSLVLLGFVLACLFSAVWSHVSSTLVLVRITIQLVFVSKRTRLFVSSDLVLQGSLFFRNRAGPQNFREGGSFYFVVRICAFLSRARHLHPEC